MSSLVKWFGPVNSMVQAPNSPKLSMTDRTRVTVVYMGKQTVCAANMLSRGTFGTGAFAGYVVNQCSCENARGDIGTLTIDWEAGGSSATQPLPIGSFSCKPQELYPKIERAIYFFGLNPDMLNAVKNALDGACDTSGNRIPSQSILNKAAGLTQSSAGVWSTPTTDQQNQLTLANKLLTKWKSGEETFYLAGWRYTYEVYSYTAPTINRGGLPGTPGGPLAAELPANVSWLRLADDLDPAGVPGSAYKLTVTWLGGPIYNGTGYWDTDIYT